MSLNRSLLALISLLAVVSSASAGAPPAVGAKAPDFALSTPGGKRVKLSEVNAKGPVALIVLRGFPGYQCPFCNRQVQDLIQKSEGFAEAGLQVVMIYPGPSQDLNAKANEFMVDKKMPDNFTLLVDPGYDFTNAYGLRWDAAKETAYPSTFLINREGDVFFSKIAKLHGGRTTAEEILAVMPKPKAAKSGGD